MATNRYLKVLIVALALAFGPSVSVVHGNAAQAAEDTSKRLNIAGRQRMLSQRMVSSLCFALSKIDAEKRSGIALAAALEFESQLAALRDGSTEQGINPEVNQHVLDALEDMAQISQPLTASVKQIASGDRHSIAMRLILERNLPTLKRMNETVELIAANSKTKEISAHQTKTINLAGRQRMLSQRIAKDACLIAIDLDREASLHDLKNSMALFDDTMQGLLVGSPEQGLLPPPNIRILRQLEFVNAQWELALKALNDIIDNDPNLNTDSRLVIAELEILAGNLDNILVEMNRAVGLWVAQTD